MKALEPGVEVDGFLVGQIMRQTKGRANPELVNRLLKDKLTGK